MEVPAKSKIFAVGGQDDHQRNVLGLNSCDAESLSSIPHQNLYPLSSLAGPLTSEPLGQCLKFSKMKKQPSVSQSTVLRKTVQQEHCIAASCRVREAGFQPI